MKPTYQQLSLELLPNLDCRNRLRAEIRRLDAEMRCKVIGYENADRHLVEKFLNDSVMHDEAKRELYIGGLYASEDHMPFLRARLVFGDLLRPYRHVIVLNPMSSEVRNAWQLSGALLATLWHEEEHMMQFHCDEDISEEGAQRAALDKSLDFACETGNLEPLEHNVRITIDWALVPISTYQSASLNILNSALWSEISDFLVDKSRGRSYNKVNEVVYDDISSVPL